MPRPLKVACLQTRPMPDFETALTEALGLAEQATSAGADFLCLPEYCGGLVRDGAMLTPPHAAEEDHPVLAGLQEFASKNSVWILVGSIAITGLGEKFINRSILLDDTGTIRSRYDKIHLFDIQLSEDEIYRESASVQPGSKAVIGDTPWARVGHSICYDLRFPYLYRDMAQAGTEILAVPAAFIKKTGAAHWHVLNTTRAIENGCFVVAPCAIGPIKGGGESYGHSLIIAPWGEVIADGGTGNGVVMAEIDLEDVDKARGRVPSLSHDRAYAAPESVKKDHT